MLDATCGNISSNRFRLPLPEVPYAKIIEKDPAPLKIAFSFADYKGRLADPECRSAIEKTAKICEELGHHVEEKPVPVDGEAFYDAFRVIWTGFAGHFFRQIEVMAKNNEKVPSALHPAISSRRVLRALTALPTDRTGRPSVMKLTRRMSHLDTQQSPGDTWLAWTELRRAELAMNEFLSKDYDLYLTPALGKETWQLGHVDERASIDSLERELIDYAGFTPLANTGGFPAMSLPLHRAASGLPVGSHFLAPIGREDRLLQLAAQIERANPWPQLAPGYES
jgi:amidase